MPSKVLILWTVYGTMLPKGVLTGQWTGDRLRAGTQNVKSCKLYVVCTRVDIWTASYVHRSSCLVTAPARPDCHSELIFINSAKPLFTVLRTRHSPYLYCTAVLNVTQMPPYWVHNGPKIFNRENCILCIMHNVSKASTDSPMKTRWSPGRRLRPLEGRPPASHDACWSAMTTNIGYAGLLAMCVVSQP